MVNPRIYRNALVIVAFAVILFGFSFENQPGPATTTLAPPSLTGTYATMTGLAAMFPNRRPGSAGDRALARYVAAQLRADQFEVSTETFIAGTAVGQRRLGTVVATRTGLSPGEIVVVAGRDALRSPAANSLAGTATLLELGRALSGETQPRTIALVSTSGSDGAAGTASLARSLATQQSDAVIVLGDLAGDRIRQPLVVPWSNASVFAPPILRNTLAATVAAQAGLHSTGGSLLAQFAHLALPIATTAQGPFGTYGIPAVALSVSSDQAVPPQGPANPSQLAALGTAVLQAVDALSSGPSIPPPASYLVIGGKLVPAWAVGLLALALIAPVLLTVIDALARARRRGHSLRRWTAWALVGAVPFLLAYLLIRFAVLSGWVGATPPSPVWAGSVGVHLSEVALLVAIGLVVVACLTLLRRLLVRRLATIGSGARDGSELDGAAVGLMLVMTVTALLIWVGNPFAALLAVPALHLWLWLAEPGVRARRWLLVPMLLLGVLAPAAVIAYYGLSLGLSVPATLWAGVLLIAGGQLAGAAIICWSVLLGCVCSATVIVVRSFRERTSEQQPVITVRGPVTYAGPGSLGGTKSALRR
jgi:hypothetical protein